jgi:transposase InsO family protein
LAYLKRQQRGQRWPAASPITNILKRHHMVAGRPRRRHTPPYNEPSLGCTQPNEVWCADFKGQFRLGEGRLCYPFTLTDSYSRYRLGCWALEHPTFLATQRCLGEAFRRYGLPCAIRTDNGTPFASVGVGGLSSLGVWLIKPGIQPERIEKAHPEQNGRHERMHRTLKEEAVAPPRKNLAEQQRAFDRFRVTYNDERPHEALGQRPPASVYRSSARAYPARLPEVAYPEVFTVRAVKANGDFKWRGAELYLGAPLAGEKVGLRQIDSHTYQVYFSFYPLALFDQTTLRITSLCKCNLCLRYKL